MKLRTANKIMSRLEKAEKRFYSFNKKYPIGTIATNKLCGDFHRIFLRCRKADKRWEIAFNRLQKYRKKYTYEESMRLLFDNMGHDTWKKLEAKARKRELTIKDIKFRHKI